MGPINPWKLTGYKPGQNVKCTVEKSEPGGYAVYIQSGKDFLPAFLPTQLSLRQGEEVLAQYIKVQDHRILLSPLFNNTSVSIKATNHERVRWEEHLDEIDRPMGSSEPMSYQEVAKPAPIPVAQAVQTEAEEAFNVWASAVQPRKFHLKRAIDLILPPIDQTTLEQFKMLDRELVDLISFDLEGGMRTGCLKASSETRLSRAAMLLFRGRVVGCIYGCKTLRETQPTKESLELMLADMSLPDTDVKLYDLPEDVTLAMSALFLGYPVPRNDEMSSAEYVDYICNWFASKQQTACLAITLAEKRGTCLGFIHEGRYCGAFYVEDQIYQPEKEYVYQLLQSYGADGVEASILPPEMTSSVVRFGYSLSMVAKPPSSSAS